MINNESEFIFVPITDEMRESARIASQSFENNLRNSIRKGKGTYAGCLGEEIFHHVFPFMKRENTFDYDFTYGEEATKLTFDIKTKERTVFPKLFYDCSVNLMNGKQDVDYYVFAQVLNTYDCGWLLGLKKSSTFFEEAVFHPKGSGDHSNNFTFHCDTYNMEISKLRAIKKPAE